MFDQVLVLHRTLLRSPWPCLITHRGNIDGYGASEAGGNGGDSYWGGGGAGASHWGNRRPGRYGGGGGGNHASRGDNARQGAGGNGMIVVEEYGSMQPVSSTKADTTGTDYGAVHANVGKPNKVRLAALLAKTWSLMLEANVYAGQQGSANLNKYFVDYKGFTGSSKSFTVPAGVVAIKVMSLVVLVN